MAARPRALTETDTADWARFAGRIVPLRGRRAAVVPSADVPTELVMPARPRSSASVAASSIRPVPIGIGGQPAGLDSATWQRFHRGQLSSARKLDLHGMTAQHAFHALQAFLRAAHAERLRCVEIVTGRGSPDGGGVLRRELPIWLNLPEIRPMVLAATHPHASNALHSRVANQGSVRLLLRRPRA
jgi:DNA-nicking Smr family endonuclease